MEKNMFKFKINENSDISPEFEPERLIDSISKSKKSFLEIYGKNDSSLIAVTAVADYVWADFYRLCGEVQFEWSFYKDDTIPDNQLHAKLSYPFKVYRGGRLDDS
ncbi:hypothetical protein [Natranaerofaba carboxydovora]|uniref:hypothetical protein n=1 Tax=Natranaerofaba carboxydovora TaxID=2742683 RepID=UPI001F14336C|nr:hypothetical protein [Natranaerofaba carboxydovora]UMZ73018.1 hypothetical protein ACONDI_00562 [Natranaerofaba carboxydovora]